MIACLKTADLPVAGHIFWWVDAWVVCLCWFVPFPVCGQIWLDWLTCQFASDCVYIYMGSCNWHCNTLRLVSTSLCTLPISEQCRNSEILESPTTSGWWLIGTSLCTLPISVVLSLCLSCVFVLVCWLFRFWTMLVVCVAGKFNLADVYIYMGICK